MKTSRRPISFVASADPHKAKTFYQSVMGLTLIEVSPYALVFEDNGLMLRVQILQDHTPPPYTVHGWQVGDIAQQIASLTAKGVTIQTFEHLNQDDHGIWTTPNGDQIAWFKDPSGNILSLTEFKSPPALS